MNTTLKDIASNFTEQLIARLDSLCKENEDLKAALSKLQRRVEVLERSSRFSKEAGQTIKKTENEQKPDEEVVEKEEKMEVVVHAPLPLQEEEANEMVEQEELSTEGVQFFLHPDSEPVWFDKKRYDDAESRFYSLCSIKEEESLSEEEHEMAEQEELSTEGVQFFLHPDSEPVWLQKKRYDDAESRFYSLCSKSVETLSEEEQAMGEIQKPEKEASQKMEKEEKREMVFSAPLPIEEEETNQKVGQDLSTAGFPSFLHPDSEPVWLDKKRHDDAESRFYAMIWNKEESLSEAGQAMVETENDQIPNKVVMQAAEEEEEMEGRKRAKKRRRHRKRPSKSESGSKAGQAVQKLEDNQKSDKEVKQAAKEEDEVEEWKRPAKRRRHRKRKAKKVVEKE